MRTCGGKALPVGSLTMCQDPGDKLLSGIVCMFDSLSNCSFMHCRVLIFSPCSGHIESWALCSSAQNGLLMVQFLSLRQQHFKV